MSGPSNIEAAGPEAVDRAAKILGRGGLVAFPTETVYGLGANALDREAVARLYAAKGRPARNPLIVHAAAAPAAEGLAEFDDRARPLADRFWPGALTLVLPLRASGGLAPAVTAGLGTVAVRVPAHGVARDLLIRAGVPVAAPSANRSGGVSPTTASHVAADLGSAVDLILDAGPCPVGIESTVVALGGDEARLLRPGAVAAESVAAVLGFPLAEPHRGPLESPGMLPSHYAPRARLRLEADAVAADEALLAFGPRAFGGASVVRNLSPSGSLAEAAANLYAALRELDESGAATIAVAPIPDKGLGRALNDRLRRAAAPRHG